MNLVIDQGNTLFKVGLFNDNELISKSKFQYAENNQFIDWVLKKTKNEVNIIISSVVDKTISFDPININRQILLNSSTVLPIKNRYATPQTLGKDRLANAVGAWSLNPSENSLVIDLGTCIKYDLVTKKGEYLGGNISPGLQMRYKSLEFFTDQLPLLNPTTEEINFGTDTQTSMQCGVQAGIENEINGFISRYKEMFSDLTIFMTGGDTKFFDNSIKNHIFANSNLTLIGLNEILKHNG